jgi:MFS family permease
MEYKYTVLSNTTLGALMASINGTIILISLPVIFRGLSIDPFATSNFPLLIWLLLGYGVVTATLLVTFGRLSDMFGRARLYNLGFAIFTAGSVMAFLTPSSGAAGGWELVGFRIIQGMGGAFLFANSAALITDAFPHTERGKALGINQVAAIGGSLVGLVLGGLLAGVPDIHLGGLTIAGWRLIFLVSVPVGLFGTVWAYWKLHEIGTIRKGQRIDWLGNATFGAGLTLLLVAVTYGLLPYGSSSMGWGSPWVWTGIIIGLALLAIFPFIELRVPDPMFRLELFRIRAFTAGNLAGTLGSIARGGVMFMMIIWFQGIWLPLHGYSYSQTPLWAGIFMMPMMAGFIALGPLSGWLSDKHGAKYLASLGMVISAITFGILLTLPYNFYYPEMGATLFLMGCGMGMFAAPNTAAIMNSVPPEHRGAASGMRATLQNSGMQISMALFFTVVLVGLSTGLSGSVGTSLSNAGVPSGTGWSVAFNDGHSSSTTGSISFTAPDGSYAYSLGTVFGFAGTPSSGYVVVNGENVTQPITFAPMMSELYTVSINESGLPLGTQWSVELNSTLYGSNTTSIELYEPNGTYYYEVTSVAGYTASPSIGTLRVDGGNVTLSTTFTPLSAGQYSVIFSETGLPAATNWSVELNGVTQSSLTSNVSFSEPNGTYSYVVGTIPGYSVSPSSANLTVSGSSKTEVVTFSSLSKGMYTVTFTETGLPPGPAAILSTVVSSDPSGALFGAFLGYNPMGIYLNALPQINASLPHSVYLDLTSKTFFPNAIAPAFLNGMDVAFTISIVMTCIAAIASSLRGGRYIHGHTVNLETGEVKEYGPEGPKNPTDADADATSGGSAK